MQFLKDIGIVVKETRGNDGGKVVQSEGSNTVSVTISFNNQSAKY